MFSETTVSSWDTTTEGGSEAVFQAIHDRLAAVGLVQTADTGQINLGGTNTPAVNSNAGYEIWRFDDAAQATDPIFLRIEYGWGPATGRLRLQCSAGTGSNGSGTLTSPHTTTSDDLSSAPAAGSTGRIAASLVNGAFLLSVSAPNSAGGVAAASNLYWIVERLRDPVSPYALKAGCFYSGYSDGTAAMVDLWLRAGGAWASGNCCKGIPASEAASNRVVAGFLLPRLQPFAPLRAVLTLPTGSVADGDTGSVIVHGAAANYKRLAGLASLTHQGTICPAIVCTD